MMGGRVTEPATIARVLAVALPLLALVALAADAGVPWAAGESAEPSARSGSGDGRYVAVGLVLATTAAATFLLVRSWQRRRRQAADDEPEEPDERPARGLDRFLVSLLAYLLLGLMVAGFFFAAREAVRWLPANERRDAVVVQEEDPAPAGRTPRADLTWLLTTAVLVVAIAAAMAAVWPPARRRLPRSHFPAGYDEQADEHNTGFATLVEETVDDLRAERDARRAIIAAYARMERGLARKGVPRRHWEAPLEYLGRVLVERRADAGDVARLTGLFERAKFSREAISPAAKAAAIECLLAIRHDVERIE